MNKKKIILLTHDSIFSRVVLDQLIRNKFIDIAGIILSTCVVRRGKNNIREYLYLVKKTGIRYTMYLFSVSVLLPFINFKLKSFTRFARENKIPLFKTVDINSVRFEKLLSDLHPDYLLSFNFNQKIMSNIYSVPKIAALNIHPSFLPYYRGVDPLLSVRVQNEKNTGVSIHLINENLDEGDILLQKQYPVNYRISLSEGYIQLFKHGTELAAGVMENFSKFYTQRIKQDKTKGSYHGWPSSEDYIKYTKGYIKNKN